MFRKTSVALAALLVATTAAISPAAHAATKISNGVACTKKNATTKVGTDKYTCTTNPTATGAAAKKLVWVWAGCLDANQSYVKTKSQYDSILKEINGQSTTLLANIQNSVNNMILWKTTKSYSKDDIVYESGKTYYIALGDSKDKLPSANLGVLWAIYKPSTIDPNVGTSPDTNLVISMKQKDIVDWTNDIQIINKEITRLQELKNPTVKDKNNLASFRAAVNTFNIGIKNANTNIKNLKANILLLTSQETSKITVESLKSDVDQANTIRVQSCAKGV